jgi:hypothetical protein
MDVLHFMAFAAGNKYANPKYVNLAAYKLIQSIHSHHSITHHHNIIPVPSHSPPPHGSL